MRISMLLPLLFLAITVSGQTPTPQPEGNLNEVMRGIFFPNANIIFDVQVADPEAPQTRDEPLDSSSSGRLTARLAGVYGGWMAVENSAVALGEVANLMMIPGRVCENGNPVPSDEPNWAKYVQELREASRVVYQAAQSRSREAVSVATDQLSASCDNCHGEYRNVPGGSENRCAP